MVRGDLSPEGVNGLLHRTGSSRGKTATSESRTKTSTCVVPPSWVTVEGAKSGELRPVLAALQASPEIRMHSWKQLATAPLPRSRRWPELI